jgi:hypothetical protein
MAESRVTITVEDSDTFKTFQIVGTATTLAAAKAEAQKKLAMTAGVTVLGVNESQAGTLSDYPNPSGTVGKDASLTLRKGTDRSTTRSIPIKSLDTTLADSVAQDGSVDVSATAITDFGSAYRDKSGTGGYTVIRGAFVD